MTQSVIVVTKILTDDLSDEEEKVRSVPTLFDDEEVESIILDK